MEKSTQNTNRVKSSQSSNKESSSRKPTNIPQEYFNLGHPAPTGDQASQRPYFNTGTLIEDQASQRPYFNDAQNNPNNQPSQPTGSNYLDQGHPGYNKNRSQYAFQTSSNSNNSIYVNAAL